MFDARYVGIVDYQPAEHGWNGMVGMVWMEWYGMDGMVSMVWYGWNGMVWMEWYGMDGIVWYGWDGMGTRRCGLNL